MTINGTDFMKQQKLGQFVDDAISLCSKLIKFSIVSR